jgi:hypothetical protein
LIGQLERALELDPNSLIPVAATIMLTPPVPIVVRVSPSPIVAVDMQAELGPIVIFLFGVPAVAIPVADDGGRGTCYG